MLRTKRSATTALIAELPSLPNDHIAALHTDVIRVFASKLRHDLTTRGPAYHRVVDLQSSLLKDLGRSIPLMIPLFRKDEASCPELRQESGRSMTIVNEDQSRVWIDDLLEIREQYVDPRLPECYRS